MSEYSAFSGKNSLRRTLRYLENYFGQDDNEKLLLRQGTEFDRYMFALVHFRNALKREELDNLYLQVMKTCSFPGISGSPRIPGFSEREQDLAGVVLAC